MIKNFFKDLVLAFKKAISTPNLPSHVLDILNSIFIRILRLLVGISIVLLIAGNLHYLGNGLIFNISLLICVIINLSFLVYIIWFNYHRVKHTYYLVKSDKLGKPKSPITDVKDKIDDSTEYSGLFAFLSLEKTPSWLKYIKFLLLIIFLTGLGLKYILNVNDSDNLILITTLNIFNFIGQNIIIVKYFLYIWMWSWVFIFILEYIKYKYYYEKHLILYLVTYLNLLKIK